MSDISKGMLVRTPAGRLSYPNLYHPVKKALDKDDLVYRTDLIIPYSLAEDSKHAQRLEAFLNVIHTVGQAKFGTEFSWVSACDDAVLQNLGVAPAGVRQKASLLKDFHSAVSARIQKKRLVGKSTDSDEKMLELPPSFVIRPWTNAATKTKTAEENRPPMYLPEVGADGKPIPLSDEQRRAVKGGDWALAIVNIVPYVTPTSWGLGVYLQGVQFWKQGEAFGGDGVAAVVEVLDSLDVAVEDSSMFSTPADGAPPFVQQAAQTGKMPATGIPNFLKK